MIGKEDKDAIIKHLVETLDALSEKIESMDYSDFYCVECGEATVDDARFNEQKQELIDYIWHRKMDVTF